MLFTLGILLISIRIPLEILLSIFVWNVLTLKIFLLTLLIIFIYYFIKKDPYSPLFSKFPQDYFIATFKDHIINIGIIMSYVTVFIVGILWLRLSNQGRSFDLRLYQVKLLRIIDQLPIYEIIVNGLLFLCVFIVYILILKVLNSYFKYNLIKRHLFHMRLDLTSKIIGPVTRYERFIVYLKNHLNLSKFHATFIRTTVNIIFNPIIYLKHPQYLNPLPVFKKFIWDTKIKLPYFYWDGNNNLLWLTSTAIKINLYRLHYILLFSTFIYDIFYNNLTLHYIYILLPYTFIYELYCRLSKAVLCLDWICNDKILCIYIYHNNPLSIEIDEEGTVYFKGQRIPEKDINYAIFNYLLKDLVSETEYEIFFEPDLGYRTFILPIEFKIRWKYHNLKQWYIKHVPLTQIDIICLIPLLILIQALFNKIL